MIDVLNDLIDIARKSENAFTPILTYESRTAAYQACTDFKEICDQRDVVFSVEEEDGKYYVGIGFSDVLKCGGELDKYCEVCKVVHFDLNGLNSAESEKKKKEFYANWAGRIRDKSEVAS